MTIGTAFVGTVRSTTVAATLHVPRDFATIQACIDAAVSGVDECVVAPGTYHETINFLGKAIAVRGSGGAGATTIDAAGIGGSVATCFSGEGPDTVLDGFTITGGTGTNDGGHTYGGGMLNYDSSPTITNCTFGGNAATYSGGGMHNWGGHPTITHCVFSENIAVVGGGMSNYYANTTVAYCTFRGNKAVGGPGGGIYNEHSSPTVVDCTFTGNAADEGGGILSVGASGPTVSNSTFSGNRAQVGGGMYNGGSHAMTITGCVLWGDTPDEIVNYHYERIIRFSNVQGGLPVGAVDGGGNIDLEPMFVRPPNPGPDGTWDGVDDDYGDLRLQAGSPCIDMGDPAFVAQPGETDLEGHARVLCGPVDMGAYEFGIGDYDCDQVVDLADFSSWQACMTGPLDSAAFHSTIDIRQSTIGCESFDFDGDGSVTLLDFGGFQRVFAP
jgi:hypothetical protein